MIRTLFIKKNNESDEIYLNWILRKFLKFASLQINSHLSPVNSNKLLNNIHIVTVHDLQPNGP